MSCEVSLSYVDFDELKESYGSLNSIAVERGAPFYQSIFSLPISSSRSQVAVHSVNKCSEIEYKTQGVARDYVISPASRNVGGKAEITIEWGGKEGPTISGSVSGRVSDNNGNKAEVKVEVDSDGSGKATVSAERDEKDSSSKKGN